MCNWLLSNVADFSRTNANSAVQYESGAFYNRSTQKDTKGFQIDLIFDRNDKVYTVCKIKYTKAPVGKKAIQEFETKLNHLPDRDKRTIHKVLISAAGADAALLNSGYFDNVVTLKDLLDER